MKQYACTLFQPPGFNELITITKRAVKEWLNQPFADVEAKNEALLQLPQLMQSTNYRGYIIDKHDEDVKAHLFEVMIGNTKAWIIIRQFHNGKVMLHSITDSPHILDKLK